LNPEYRGALPTQPVISRRQQNNQLRAISLH
jgi:hypothetical protein